MDILKSNLTEDQDKLWQAILAKVEEIQQEEGRRGSRDQGWLTSDGKQMSTILDIQKPDGSHRVFRIRAHHVPYGPARIEMRVDRWFHNGEGFWEEQLSDRTNAAVIDGHHYRVRGRENAYSKGFGGRRHTIRFFDGREVTTTDLWYQGVIPPAFRDRLPDDAEFVAGGDPA